jgi:tripartite-type tricarboxylate transporter receptor subunit TctC
VSACGTHHRPTAHGRPNSSFPVNAALGVTNIKDLIVLAKAKPDRLTFGSWGSGTLSHLLALQLAKEADISIVHVPYKSATASLNDVVAGHVALMFDYTPTCKPLIEAGKLRALMTVGPKRSKVLPDVPSAAELGMPNIQHQGWSVILAPAKSNVATLVNDRKWPA